MGSKRLFAIILMSLFCLTNEAQTIYTCNGKYRIELPDKLELQDSELNNVKRVYAQKYQQINISTHSDKIVFQQKGLNADLKSALSKYCRVIVDYFKEDRNDPTFGRGDQIVVDKDMLYMVHESVKVNCDRSGTPLIKFFLFNRYLLTDSQSFTTHINEMAGKVNNLL